MTEQELYEKLIPLEPAMIKYIETKGGTLTSADTALMKECYSTIQKMSAGVFPKRFTTSCSSCVRNVFEVYISVYYKLKEKYTSDIKSD